MFIASVKICVNPAVSYNSFLESTDKNVITKSRNGGKSILSILSFSASVKFRASKHLVLSSHLTILFNVCFLYSKSILSHLLKVSTTSLMASHKSCMLPRLAILSLNSLTSAFVLSTETNMISRKAG